jgi:hypothetical protein
MHGAFVWKCTNMCKHRFGGQLLQNPPLCSSPVIKTSSVGAAVCHDEEDGFILERVGQRCEGGGRVGGGG